MQSIKTLTLALLAYFSLASSEAQQATTYYGVGGKVIELTSLPNKYLLTFGSDAEANNFSNLISAIGETKRTRGKYVYLENYGGSQTNLKAISGIKYVSPFYKSGDIVIKPTNQISFKAKPSATQSQLDQLYAQLNISKVTSSSTLLEVDLNSDVFEISRNLFETGYFEYAEPNYLFPIYFASHKPKDKYFDQQFYLENTGQIITSVYGAKMQGTPGADINVTKAWDITKGDPSIIVAVMDCGVSNNHPDLPASRIVSGYNAIEDNDDPTPEKFKTINHGNACAGIIAAEMDNEIGIAGIAPYCKIMPIKIGIGGADQPGYPNPNTPPNGDDVKADELTRAFNHAIENNASIINCSWYAGPDFIDMNSTAQYAISDAAGKGRNGKGIIIVFCIGNLAMHDGEPPYWTQKDKDGYLGWPSRLNIPGVISVGASDRNDEQANYSPHSYNAKETPSYFIDVVAPSHKKYDNDVDVVEGTCVMTIDEVGSEYGYNYEDQLSHEQNGCPDATGDISAYDYACNFGGTSAAAPQVSAVAALMLSVNPELTYLDVEDLIKGTADKKGPYNYNVSVSYPGTSREMGAGRLNALRAVERANEFTYAKNADLAIKDIQGDLYAEPNPEENMWISPDIWVRNTDDGRIHQYTEEKLNYDPGKKNTFYVYVRVKNKGLQYSQGYEKIIAYWAKASTSVSWPAPWDGSANQNSPFPLGNRIALPKTIPPIAPGGETIISFQWTDVPDPKIYEAQFGTNDRGHFCFLARIEQFPDAPYGMASPEKDGELYGNIRNNNNIASKNVIISRTYGLTKQFPKRCILVSNVSNPTSAIDLVFRAPVEERTHSIFDNGDVKIEVAPQVYQAWTLGGMLGEKILAAGNQIKLTGDNATLKNIKLPLKALYNVCVTYSPKVNVFGTSGGVYSLDIIQKVGKTTIGGERFQFVEDSQPSAMPFLAKETSDQKLLGQICTQQDSKLVIEDQRTSTTTKRVKLTDVFGKEIGTFDYYLTGTFEISSLLPGAYLVNIVELETGKIFNQRFIFMK